MAIWLGGGPDTKGPTPKKSSWLDILRHQVVTIGGLFGIKKVVDPTISEVRDDITSLVGSILKEKPTNIIQLGLKSSFLVAHQATRLDASGFTRQTLRHNRLDDSFYHRRLSDTSPVLVLTDSIYRGDEIRAAIKYLQERNIEITKVFCYLAKQSGLESLFKEGVLKPDQVFSSNTTENDDDYKHVSSRLHVYFYSRIEPTGGNLVYNLYSVNEKLSFWKFRRFMKQVFRTSIKTDLEFKKDSLEGLPSDIWIMEATIPDHSFAKQAVTKVLGRPITFDVNYIHITIKVRRKRVSSDFVVIVDSDISCDPISTNDDRNCIVRGGQPCPKGGADGVESHHICAGCIGHCLSGAIIDTIEDEVVSAFTAKKKICRLVTKERPSQSYLEYSKYDTEREE